MPRRFIVTLKVIQVVGFLKQITSASCTIKRSFIACNMERDPEFNVELSLYENISNLSNVPDLCDVFVKTLINFYVES